jgi:membrane glycosyltransferase
MQHMKLLRAKGFHWLSRLHLLTGILSYATSPIWMAVLVLSSVVICLQAIQGHQYFEPGAFTLFPNWPESRVDEIASLLTVTIIVLLLPKVLGTLLALDDPQLRRGFGGTKKLLSSLLVEQAISVLLAPTMMVFHATFVLSTLAGVPVVWNAQERGDRGITFGEAFKRHRWQMALGLVWGAVILWFAPAFIYWMLPVIIGLLASMPLTVYTSRTDLGLRLRERELLMTPEESNIPLELAELRALQLSPPIADSAPPASEMPAIETAGVPALAPLIMEPEPLEVHSVRASLRHLFGGHAAEALPEVRSKPAP